MSLKSTLKALLYGTENKSRAMRFVILIGIVSLFADMTYEGARSITGAYLAVLGANAAIVGMIAGGSELVGYALRYLFGYWADRTRRYWLIAFMGYAINLLAVPLLALANHWWLAAGLIVLERLGKAVRTPARDVLLSQGGKQLGMGWAFGVHQAFDQTGSMLGPLIVGLVLFLNGSYQEGFAWLAVPALLALWVLVMARELYASPEITVAATSSYASSPAKIWHKPFVLYLIGTGFIAVGYADFALIAYHFEVTKLLKPEWIPIVYGASMGVNILLAPLLGRMYDHFGIWIIIGVAVISAFFAPLVFLGSPWVAAFGVLLWGIGMGTQASLFRAVIGNMIEESKRGTAYGIFNMVFGVCWFLGSTSIGFLYDFSIPSMVVFILVFELLS
ncbi:MAG: MFS transporter, partial [Legionellales bacterium]